MPPTPSMLRYEYHGGECLGKQDSQNTKLLSLSGYSVDEDVVWGLSSMRNFMVQDCGSPDQIGGQPKMSCAGGNRCDICGWTDGVAHE